MLGQKQQQSPSTRQPLFGYLISNSLTITSIPSALDKQTTHKTLSCLAGNT